VLPFDFTARPEFRGTASCCGRCLPMPALMLD